MLPEIMFVYFYIYLVNICFFLLVTKFTNSLPLAFCLIFLPLFSYLHTERLNWFITLDIPDTRRPGYAIMIVAAAMSK